MNCTQNTSSSTASYATTSYAQVAMILGALLAGAVLTQVVPDVRPMAAYVQQTRIIPTTEVFKHANTQKPTHDASRDLTGIDVDVRRLAMLGRVS